MGTCWNCFNSGSSRHAAEIERLNFEVEVLTRQNRDIREEMAFKDQELERLREKEREGNNSLKQFSHKCEIQERELNSVKSENNRLKTENEMAVTQNRNLRQQCAEIQMMVTRGAGSECATCRQLQAELEKVNSEKVNVIKQMNAITLEKVKVEGEIKQFKAEFERLQLKTSRDIELLKEQLQQREEDLSAERNKVLSQYENYEQEKAQHAELEKEKRKIKDEFLNNEQRLQSLLRKESDNKLKMAEQYEQDKEQIFKEHAKTLSELSDTYETTLKEKNEEIKNVRQDMLRTLKENSARFNKMEAEMKKSLEDTCTMYQQAATGANEQAELIIKTMYTRFEEALKRQSKLLHEAQERERILRTRRGYDEYEEEEDEEGTGVEIEEVED